LSWLSFPGYVALEENTLQSPSTFLLHRPLREEKGHWRGGEKNRHNSVDHNQDSTPSFIKTLTISQREYFISIAHPMVIA
jgi:hypothetical protein